MLGERSIQHKILKVSSLLRRGVIFTSLHGYREEVLNAHLFESISDVQQITDDWLWRYNEIRPHDALGSLPPARYREKLLAATSTLELST